MNHIILTIDESGRHMAKDHTLAEEDIERAAHIQETINDLLSSEGGEISDCEYVITVRSGRAVSISYAPVPEKPVRRSPAAGPFPGMYQRFV